MIQADLLDRTEYKIGEDWSVHEIMCVCCPKCGLETVETHTYREMTLYYHTIDGGDKLGLCVVGNIQEPLEDAFVPLIDLILGIAGPMQPR